MRQERPQVFFTCLLFLSRLLGILAAAVDCGVKKLSIGGASVGLRRGDSERNRIGHWRRERGYV